MRNKIFIGGIASFSILSLLSPCAQVFAADVSAVETCNVQVTFRATVPNSVEQGKSFTVTNITVQPASTYGFNVTSSVFDMTAINTSSATYSQDFYATNPSPTTGHNTYVGLYPNWTLDAAGPVGGAVTIKLKKTVTVIQGYGGSPVTCNFTKTLASIPITAPPPPSPSPSPSVSPSSSPSSSPSKGGTSTTTSSSSTTSHSATTTQQPSTDTTKDTAANAPKIVSADTAVQPGEESVSVIPLNIEVKDSTGKLVIGAEVTLDGSKKLITDNVGRVVFSNVLTGNHALLVSYKGQKVSSNISLTAADVGEVKSIKLPAAAQTLNPITIGAAAATTAAGIGATAGVFILRRRRKAAEAALGGQAAPPAITIPGIIAGSAIETPPDSAMAHIPAIPAFAAQPTALTPAPWEPAPAPPEAAPQPLEPVYVQPQPLIDVPPQPAGEVTLDPSIVEGTAPALQSVIQPLQPVPTITKF